MKWIDGNVELPIKEGNYFVKTENGKEVVHKYQHRHDLFIWLQEDNIDNINPETIRSVSQISVRLDNEIMHPLLKGAKFSIPQFKRLIDLGGIDKAIKIYKKLK